MDDEKRMQIVMGIIMAGGNAKAHAVEAITAAKKGDFTEAEKKLEEANQAIVITRHLPDCSHQQTCRRQKSD